MSYTTKGKRAIEVNGVIFFWFVDLDKDYIPPAAGTRKRKQDRNTHLWDHRLKIISEEGDIRIDVLLDSDGPKATPKSVKPEQVYERICEHLSK